MITIIIYSLKHLHLHRHLIYVMRGCEEAVRHDALPAAVLSLGDLTLQLDRVETMRCPGGTGDACGCRIIWRNGWSRWIARRGVRVENILDEVVVLEADFAVGIIIMSLTASIIIITITVNVIFIQIINQQRIDCCAMIHTHGRNLSM